jgi:FixJ family two-component response regulator
MSRTKDELTTKGHLSIDTEAIAAITGYSVAHAQACEAKLTARQREVYELLARGYPSRGIAQQLGISLKTGDIHRGDVFRKITGKTAGGSASVAMCFATCRLAEALGLNGNSEG